MRRLQLLGGVVAVVAAAIGLTADGADPVVADVGVEAPASIVAGERLDVVVTAKVPDGTGARLVARTAYGTVSTLGRLDGARAVLVAPSAATRHAGRLDLLIQVGRSWSFASVDVVAGPVAGAPVPMIGARSVTAGGTDRAMVVVVPQDRHGNPVVVAQTNVTTLYPDGTTTQVHPRHTPTLQWLWVPARTRAGRALLIAEADGVAGSEGTLLVVPAPPEMIDFEVDAAVARADGRSLLTVETNQISDRFGNRVLDGTAVTIAAIAPDGSRLVQTVVTVGGIARATIEAPAMAGTLDIEVSIGSAAGRRQITLFPAISSDRPFVDIDVAAGPDRVAVGPILGDLGQLVPDGTRVTVVGGSGPDEIRATAPTVGGTAVLSIELDGMSELWIEAGGVGFRHAVEDGS